MEGGNAVVNDRMIIAGWIVQPVVLALHDDGTADEMKIQPQKIGPSQWQQFKDGGDEQSLEQLRVQIEIGGDDAT